MKTYTIGFTRKPAQRFFGLLRQHRVRRLLDVRLNNRSQLAGFAKQQDLVFFLRELCDIDYLHLVESAPTRPMLKAYQDGEIGWPEYQDRYLDLIVGRNLERTIDRSLLDGGCLLCSEHEPHHCHRRVLVDYLNRCWGAGLEVVHLV